ncbi:CBS domain-containing protein [Candidatus Woesearchaeota archaeon]|nr:CBS domain-containing protein [Candidatus Woesearchaeota archaeon]
MTVNPIAASPRMSIHDVALLMDKHNVGSVLIISHGNLLGLVTERDFVTRACLGGYNSRATPVSSIMSRDLITVGPGMDLFDALNIMKDAEIRHLPVMDGGRTLGFVTAKDILKIQPNLLENFVDLFQLREEGHKLKRAAATLELDDDY